MTELEYNEMKKKVRQYEYQQHRKMMKKLSRVEVIEDLDISVRLYNVLKRGGINTIQELKEYNYVNLLRVRGCGKCTFNELERLFDEKGWELIYKV
jgi:DNA-directed RNA polymerase alpha subunit